MKFNKEIQIGIAVVLAVVVFWWGNRVFSNLPLFSQGKTFYADLNHTQGLVSGSLVDIHGVGVGTVTEIIYRQQGPRVQFYVDNDVVLPQGSYVSAGGSNIFSDPRLAIVLGPDEHDPHEPGDVIPARDQTDLLGTLTEQTPDMLSRADTVLETTSQVVSTALDLLVTPQGDLRQTLNSIRVSADALAAFLDEDEGSFNAIIADVKQLSQTLITLAQDSLAHTAGRINAVAARLDTYILELEATTAELNEVLVKINNGQGTLGRLVNEDSLYANLDGSAAALRRILEQFEEDPDHYMQHLKVIEIF